MVLFFVLIRLTKRLLTATLNDKTTGLGNRELFVNSIDDHSKNLEKSVVAMLDIDEFKIINETCGNLGGDAYLHQISKLVIAVLPEKSEVCRISSDVIGFVLPSTSDNLGLLENLRKQIASFEFHWQGLNTKLTCSIGAYEVNADTSNETVLNALYASLQEAKSTGRNKVVFYNEKDDFIVGRQKQMRMVSHVSEALAQKKIVLFKQAITPVSSDKGDTYFEVLMRVKHDGVYYSPFPYLQAAERFHLITQVDRYIVTQTALYLQSTPSDKANYSVNLSGQTLSDPSLPDFFERLFARIKITPNQLGFEITETDVIRNFKVALINVKYLRSKGCKISLDDFGTGMSSYAYLSELNVDTLKIDGTFIQNIDKDKLKQAIVESIILLSNKLQLNTVAEFVETESEFNVLASCKIDYCQGYLVHKPELFYEPIGD
ncbi:MAG: diguanylate cyclase (GGDEF)-like protein [Pseudomonadales bacterium]